jgi:hypothetical protein
MTLRAVLVTAAVALLPLFSAEPGRAGSLPVLDLAWAWTLPRPSAIPASVIDIDGDGVGEVLLSDGGSWQVEHVGTGFEQTFTSLPFEGGIQAMTAVPRDSGGFDVVFANGGQVRIQDAQTGAELRSFPTIIWNAAAIAVADLMGSGSTQVVLCGWGGLAVNDYETGALVASNPAMPCSQMAIGQLDDDQALEIAIAHWPDPAMVLDGLTLGVEWTTLGDSAARLAIGNLDASGHDELVLSLYDSQALTALDIDRRQPLWSTLQPNIGAVVVGDVSGGPPPEVLVAGAGPGGEGLGILDGPSGSPLWSLPELETAWIAIGDLDADSLPDILWAFRPWSEADRQLFVSNSATGELEAASPPDQGLFHALAAVRLRPNDPPSLLASSRPLDTATLGAPWFWDARRGTPEPRPALPPALALDFDRIYFALPLDADGNGEDELVLGLHASNGLGDALASVNPNDETLRWLVRFPSGSTLAAGAQAEIDGDPAPEIVVAVGVVDYPLNDRLVYAFDTDDGWLKWRSPPLDPEYGPSYAISALATGDVDGDGGVDVVLLGGNLFDESLTILSGATGAIELPTTPRPALQLELAQLDGDPEQEIVISTFDGSIDVLDPRTAAVESTLVQIPGAIDDFAIADWTRDGVPDFAIVQGTALSVLDGASLLPIWTAPFLGQSWGDVSQLLAADLDLDGRPDLAVASSWGVAVFSIPLDPIFSDGFESGDTSVWSATVP